MYKEKAFLSRSHFLPEEILRILGAFYAEQFRHKEDARGNYKLL